MKTKLYVFQWISDLGGADTRLKELLVLLKNDFDITCIPNDDFRLKEKNNTDFLDYHGIKYVSFKNLPKKLEGFAYSNCNFNLFETDRVDFINDSGLKFIWSNDMMWTTNKELDFISRNKIDCVLFTSKFHKEILGKKIFRVKSNQKNYILPNYFDSSTWKYAHRPIDKNVVFGKVSRDDFMKFSENFPVFYESATSGLPVNYSIMGWNSDLQKKYNWFNFSGRWSFLKPNEISTNKFYESIDVFLYDCNFRFIENQSRAIIESQLTGCPVIAPNKWNFPNMIWNQRTGFLWNNLDELKEYCKEIMNRNFRRKMGKMASQFTRDVWCDPVPAKEKWFEVLDYLEN